MDRRLEHNPSGKVGRAERSKRTSFAAVQLREALTKSVFMPGNDWADDGQSVRLAGEVRCHRWPCTCVRKASHDCRNSSASTSSWTPCAKSSNLSRSSSADSTTVVVACG